MIICIKKKFVNHYYRHIDVEKFFVFNTLTSCMKFFHDRFNLITNETNKLKSMHLKVEIDWEIFTMK